MFVVNSPRSGKSRLSPFFRIDLRATKDYDCRRDVVLAEQGFGFLQFQLHAYRSLLCSSEKINVQLGQPIAVRIENGPTILFDLLLLSHRWLPCILNGTATCRPFYTKLCVSPRSGT